MKPGRNDPCSCGSGKRYKHCCEGKVAPRPAAPPSAEFNTLVTLLNTRRYAELENQSRMLIQRYPDSGLVWKLLGTALQMQGKEALPAIQKTAELMPNDAEAHFNLGVALKNLGRLDDAVASYRRTLALKPDSAETHYNLGAALKSLGQLDDAVASYQRALKLRPEAAHVHFNLGNALKDLGQLDAAVASYQRALKIKPDFAEAHTNLGYVLKDLGQFEATASCYRLALALRPDSAEAHYNLGNALQDLGQYSDAVSSYERALQIKPDFADALCNLGNAFTSLGQFDRAETIYHHTLEVEPKNIGAMLGLGNICSTNGEMGKTEALCRNVLEIQPDNLDAHIMLASVKKIQAGDANLAALLAAELAARHSQPPLQKNQEIALHFALGKCFDDLGEYDQAFPHFLTGCKLKRATFQYDAAQTTQQFDNIMRVFDRAALERLRGGGNTSNVPIFVLGMPRSGTTLTEQIIASHPDVYGAGELPDLPRITQRGVAGTAGYPDNITALDRAGLSQWGEDYVAGLRLRAPDARHITDKLPANFKFIGLIHVMLPNAKIIHVNRNPVDTCLSCFNIFFNSGTQEQTYDLAELGRYYVDYARLMDHWREVLPAGAFLDVHYEDIVADKEVQARRMIAFCGLEWNDACLDFHTSKRSVSTASMAQVRRPIYKSSVERWRAYEKYLGPLLDALGELAPKRNPNME